ncbi:MAG: phosphoribosylformylglycinamidine cyclo-ligase [Helicobacteraceae bacterium]|jgi:phosphoribosylformylglycinamidine cyclo-ligase|nr:phosphoribosylformylglycinamidine cyclo-ligase [Helicobacteraceae bacterium]
MDYKQAGVDIEAGNAFVEAIKPVVKSTFTSGVLGSIGSFSGAFRLPEGYKKPVLLGATDGVGTKLRLAIDGGILGSVGVDLTAMCVNDLICNRGEPLFFLDYYATGKLDANEAKAVVEGIAKGCIEAECALIGGETAEMPGMYGAKDFDLAGFAVGIAEEDEITNPPRLQEGDTLIALPSSGLHSNGFSLARKLLFEKLNMKFDDPFDGATLIEVLLKPTEIYVKRFKAHKTRVKALAHITGGGIVENLPRSLSQGLCAVVESKSIRSQEIFKLMSGYVAKEEMFRTFNMGVGMIWIVDKNDAEAIAASVGGYIIGRLTSGDRSVKFVG